MRCRDSSRWVVQLQRVLTDALARSLTYLLTYLLTLFFLIIYCILNPQLLVSHVESASETIPSCLRLIFMSGDFIPLTLPSRIRRVCENNQGLRIISMGGATEGEKRGKVCWMAALL